MALVSNQEVSCYSGGFHFAINSSHLTVIIQCFNCYNCISTANDATADNT